MIGRLLRNAGCVRPPSANPRHQFGKRGGVGHSLPTHAVHYMFTSRRCRIDSPSRAVMADQIVITEKTSQAKDIRAAVGSRYGNILPAEGHLFDLLEPEDVVPAWKRWSR